MKATAPPLYKGRGLWYSKPTATNEGNDMRHHRELHETPPWKRREVARNTGQKCERSEYSPAYRAARKLERKARDRAAFAREVREATA